MKEDVRFINTVQAIHQKSVKSLTALCIKFTHFFLSRLFEELVNIAGKTVIPELRSFNPEVDVSFDSSTLLFYQ